MPPVTRSKARQLKCTDSESLRESQCTPKEHSQKIRKNSKKRSAEEEKGIEAERDDRNDEREREKEKEGDGERKSDHSYLLEKEAKKIKISEEEANLNGAPEGELFDVAVISDECLILLEHPEIDLESALKTLTNSKSTWATRHSAVEILRRICKFHSNLFDESNLLTSLSECCQEIESLRSCICRNGLFCLRALFSLCFPWTERLFEPYQRAIQLLMIKSATAPKFIISSALESLEMSVRPVPLPLLLSILEPFNTHKNPDVSSRSYSLYAQQLISSKQSLRGIMSSIELIVKCVSYLQRGLHSLRPASREMSKRAISTLNEEIGNQQLSIVIEDHFKDKRSELLPLIENGATATVPMTETNNLENDSTVKNVRPVTESKKQPRSSFRDHLKGLKKQPVESSLSDLKTITEDSSNLIII